MSCNPRTLQYPLPGMTQTMAFTFHDLQENPRSQAAIEKQKWEGPCNERLVGQLLVDLKGWGVDLESLKPSDLFDTMKGRTLWCAKSFTPAHPSTQPASVTMLSLASLLPPHAEAGADAVCQFVAGKLGRVMMKALMAAHHIDAIPRTQLAIWLGSRLCTVLLSPCELGCGHAVWGALRLHASDVLF